LEKRICSAFRAIDHIGIARPINGRQNLQRREDDGSGSALVMDNCRKPESTSGKTEPLGDFLLGDCEEKGLLGSNIRAHPTVPKIDCCRHQRGYVPADRAT